MVTKNQIKLITSLHQKKFRVEHQLFFVEGEKAIREFLDSNYQLEHLFETESLFIEINNTLKTTASESELKKISALSTPNNCLAVFHFPDNKPIRQSGLIVALDDVRDPGNLGTIIRLCDWFGITQIVCSTQTVDLYNPKVVQATMGSLTRVKVDYLDLQLFINESTIPIFGTFMDGNNIYKTNLPNEAIIVMGNEANGISKSLEQLIQNRITIPRFGNLQKTESLNVATATAIVLSEFRR